MRMPGGEGYVYYNDIHLYWKSDANHEIEEWMCCMRGHPVLQNLGYQVIGRFQATRSGGSGRGAVYDLEKELIRCASSR